MLCTKRSDKDPEVVHYLFPNPNEADSVIEYECKQWIKVCGRDTSLLNFNLVKADFVGTGKWTGKTKPKCNRKFFVCSDHFVDGKPTKANPYPVPADSSVHYTGGIHYKLFQRVNVIESYVAPTYQ